MRACLAVAIRPAVMPKALESLRYVIEQLRELIGIEEFHFTDIYAGRRQYKQIDLEVRYNARPRRTQNPANRVCFGDTPDPTLLFSKPGPAKAAIPFPKRPTLQAAFRMKWLKSFSTRKRTVVLALLLALRIVGPKGLNQPTTKKSRKPLGTKGFESGGHGTPRMRAARTRDSWV